MSEGPEGTARPSQADIERQIEEIEYTGRHLGPRLGNPFPFQHSGDAQGMRDRVRMRVADAPLRLVDRHKPHHFGA